MAAAGRRRVVARRNLLTPPGFERGRSGQCVYFLTPDYDLPAGGIRVIYRHVDLLNQAGIPAAVLHQKPGFRCSWFAHETTVRDVRHTQLGANDLLVVGELHVGSLTEGVQYPHVVFNQNPFLTWSGHPDRVARYYQQGPAPRAVLTVSEYARRVLAQAFPELSVTRVRLQIDDAFGLPDAQADRVISYMPRKGVSSLAQQVLHLVDGMGFAGAWQVQPLDGLRLHEVAAHLKRSQVFLSFGDFEGFGLPAAEAMACGNYVVGSHGYGGQEFFDPRFCAPTAVGDVLGMAEALRAALAAEEREPGWLRTKGREASQFVTRTYSRDAESADVVDFYTTVLQGLRTRPGGASRGGPARQGSSTRLTGRSEFGLEEPG